MKKLMTGGLIFTLIIFTACANNNSLSGKYTLTSASMGGVSIDQEALSKFGLDNSYLEFRDNGKMIASIKNDAQDGTYKIDGKTITFMAEGEAITGTIDGSKISISISGSTMIFEKKWIIKMSNLSK